MKRRAENISVRFVESRVSGEVYYYVTEQWMIGFLQGAYFEGLDMGQIVADCVNSVSCADLEHFVQVTNAQPYETAP